MIELTIFFIMMYFLHVFLLNSDGNILPRLIGCFL